MDIAIGVDEQNRRHRMSLVAEKYAALGQKVQVVAEIDNWRGMSGTQIYAMKRRCNLPEHYSYKISFIKEGEECPTQP